jgi:hypothetical protein
VWNVASQKTVSPLMRQTTAITQLAFEAKGKLLIIGGHDGSLRIWTLQETMPSGTDFPIDTLVAMARERVSRTLTAAEKSKYLDEPTKPAQGE